MTLYDLIGEIPVVCRVLRRLRMRHEGTPEFYTLSLLSRPKRELVNLIQQRAYAKDQVLDQLKDAYRMYDEVYAKLEAIATRTRPVQSWICCNRRYPFYVLVCINCNRRRPLSPSPHGQASVSDGPAVSRSGSDIPQDEPDEAAYLGCAGKNPSPDSYAAGEGNLPMVDGQHPSPARTDDERREYLSAIPFESKPLSGPANISPSQGFASGDEE